MPRFVVLEHARENTRHFDLMLEQGNVLLTFSFADFPQAPAKCKSLMEHRLRYLEYEGDMGSGRGTVRRVESGTFDLMAQTENAIHLHLRGLRLQGTFCLTNEREDVWRFEAAQHGRH